MFAMFSAHALHEWTWPRAHMYETTFTQFQQNCNIGCLVTLYGSTVHVATLAIALSSGSTAKLGIGSRNKAICTDNLFCLVCQSLAGNFV